MDLQELKRKMNKELGALVRYDDRGNPFVSMPVGKIPLQQFKEFNQFVESEHAGNRWLAIWTLYLRNKNFDIQAEAEAYKQELMQPQEDSEESNPLGLLNGD
jgi:hypothetical protein